MKKVITRMRGGLGNQLFCYAAARRLALVNDAELVIDDVTGFARDRQYRRRYALDRFRIAARKATPAERLEPFERYRRGLMKWMSRRRPFIERRYVEQEGLDFDARVLALKAAGTLYLDGLWQSEGYFKDVEAVIRDDLRIDPPADALNLQMAEEIRRHDAVALHVRWFNEPGSTARHNASTDYYKRAIAMIEDKVEAPRFFLFSDDPDAARRKLDLADGRVTCVSHNRGDTSVFADLWLMTQCRHFITANSSFSWWGAWLATPSSKITIAPGIKLAGVTAWGLEGQIPASWIKM